MNDVSSSRLRGLKNPTSSTPQEKNVILDACTNESESYANGRTGKEEVYSKEKTS